MSERYFISVDIDEEDIQSRLEAVQGELSQYGQNKPTNPEQFHTTLNFIGDIEEDRLSSVKQHLSNVSFTPFEMNIAGMGAFPNEDFIKVVWAGIESDGLMAVADTVRSVLPDNLAEERDFHPHVTLLRLHNISREEKTQLQETIDRVHEEEFGRLHVTTFRLKKSILTENGAQHQTIAEYSSNED